MGSKPWLVVMASSYAHGVLLGRTSVCTSSIAAAEHPLPTSPWPTRATRRTQRERSWLYLLSAGLHTCDVDVLVRERRFKEGA